MSLSALQKIREQFKEKRCPHCGNLLTVEQTEFFEVEACESCLEHFKITDHQQCCSQPELTPVRFVITNGTVQVRNQCQKCGDVSGNSLGGFTAEKRNELPLLNTQAREDYSTRRSDAYAQAYAKNRDRKTKKYTEDREANKKDWLERYDRYLNSEEWKSKRALVLKRDGYMCQACLNAFATQVHHKSYQFVDLQGNEPAFDLVAICVPCHDKIETAKREQRESN